MCRAQSEGGRRCPSCTNPEAVKAYNAIRRARYAAKKKAAMESQASIVGEPSNKEAPTTPTAIYEKIPSSSEIITEPGQTIEVDNTTYETTPEKAVMNVTEVDNEELVDIGYYAKNKVTGTLDYEYEEDQDNPFGFDGKKILVSTYKSSQNDDLRSVMYDLSETNLEKATKAQLDAIRYFTDGYGCEQINDYLYNGVKPSDKTVRRRINSIDKAFQQCSDNEPKLVYRGVKPSSSMFDGMSPAAWVDENYEVGKEIMFDGYTSSSPVSSIATNWAGYTGLVYEIYTTSGMNITSASNYSTEYEVLLPRQSRYKIVGIQKNSEGKIVVQLVAINSKGEILDGTNHDPITPVKV